MRISDWSSDVCSSDLQGVLPEDVGVARNLDHDGDDRRPSLGCAELSVLIVTLCPCDTEAVGGGADHAGDLDRNLLTPNLGKRVVRSEEHTSELQSLMRISYAVFCLKKKTKHHHNNDTLTNHLTQPTITHHSKHIDKYAITRTPSTT